MEIKITDQINKFHQRNRSLGAYATKFHPDVLRSQCKNNKNGLVTSFIQDNDLASFSRNCALNKMQISYL